MKSNNSVKFCLVLSLMVTLHFSQLWASKNLIVPTGNEMPAESANTGPFMRHSSVTNTVARDSLRPVEGNSTEPTVSHLLLPAINFPVQSVDGFIPYYIDTQRVCLAVNSIVYPNQFAAARTNFGGTSGTYDVTITTLSEIDGEPTYKLSINGNYVGSPYTQPYTGIDYSPLTHTWTNVPINNGDVIQVESNNTSNGLVPEGDAFAFARGRWTRLELSHVTTVRNDIGGRQISVSPNPVKHGSGVLFPDPEKLSSPEVEISGELRTWHKLTFTLDGPHASEYGQTVYS